MTDEDALLAGVLAAPDDDVPRLVMADWYEENGQPDRAEFIRAQIERESLPKSDPRYKELRRRERALFAPNRQQWLATFQKFWAKCHVQFRRGFVTVVKSSAECVLIHAEELWRCGPVREVYVTDAQQRIHDLCWLPRPPHVRIRVDMVANPDQLGTVTIDALPPNPSRLEPHLRAGTWLVLGYARASGPDKLAVSRLGDYVMREAAAHGGMNFAVRPYQIGSEFQSWCPIPQPDRGPHWLLLREGRLAAHATGCQEVSLLPPSFWAG